MSAALTGQVTSAEEGAMEGVLVSAKKAGSTVTITVVSDAQGNYSFPAAKLESGPICIAHPGGGLRPRSSRQRKRGCATAGEAGPEAAQDRRSRRPALERGMARELPRQRPAEERDAGLRGLPHARARGALDPQTRRFHPRHAAAHAGLREPEHSGRTPASPRRAADGRTRGPARPGLSRHGRLSRQRQSELGIAVELRAQAPAPPERPQHTRGHHRI